MTLVSFKHKIWNVCKLWFVSIFSKWSDRKLVFKIWIMVCVFLKGSKDEIHKCHWVVIFSHYISSKTHLSTFKLALINGESKNKISFFLTQDRDQMLNSQESNLESDELCELQLVVLGIEYLWLCGLN
jgi:hypothetical protein